MNSNQKKFGIYVFFSTFSRNLIEVFIPVILYKYGFSLKEILLYYLLANVISLIISYPFVQISKKYSNKMLAILGIVAFVVLQISLNFITQSYKYIFLIATFFAIYRRGYWISRRYYNLNVVQDKNIATTYSIISIINQLGIIFSAYLGSIILDYINLKLLTIFAILLFLASTIPLFLLDFKHEINNKKIQLLEIFKNISKSDVYLFGSYELVNVIKFLIPVYLFIYVKNTYQTIGIVNLITNLALIIFTYLFGKKLDKSKNDYLKISIILVILTYIFKVNSLGYILLIVSFVEGITLKMYELSINKKFYTLSKNFEYTNYNLMYEITQNSFRSIVTLILYLSNFELKTMIYITLAFIFIGVFLNNKNKLIEKKEKIK